MKVFATLASLFLLINSIYALAAHHHHSRHHSSKHHHEKSVFQSRASAGSCDWKCTDQNGNQVTTVPSGSWAIDIVGGATSTVTLTLIYDASSGFFAIFNREVNVLVLFRGGDQFYAIINLNTRGTLIVNYSLNYAQYLEISTQLAAAAQTNLSSFFSLAVTWWGSVRVYANSFLIMTAQNSFNIGLILSTIGLGSISWNVVFLGRYDLQVTVQKSFQAMFTAAASRLSGFGIFVQKYGTFNLFAGLFGTVRGLQEGFLGIMYYVAVSLGGFTSANIQVAYKLVYAVSINFGGFLSGSIYGVSVAAGGVLVFVNASGTELFRVLLSGAVYISGQIVGYIGQSIQALASIVAGFSFNFSFGFGFGAAAGGGASVGK